MGMSSGATRATVAVNHRYHVLDDMLTWALPCRDAFLLDVTARQVQGTLAQPLSYELTGDSLRSFQRALDDELCAVPVSQASPGELRPQALFRATMSLVISNVVWRSPQRRSSAEARMERADCALLLLCEPPIRQFSALQRARPDRLRRPLGLIGLLHVAQREVAPREGQHN